MASVNKVILIGNLGSEPELKYTPSNRPVCNLSVATNEVWKDKNGQKQEKTEWHRVIVWGEQGENAAKYLAKGRMVYVEGKLQTRTWDDKEGKKRYTTEIVADRVVFLSGQQAEGGQAGGGRRNWGGQQQDLDSTRGGGDGGNTGGHGAGGYQPPADDDIPF
jgi:single-strand DNA-binding protein